MILDDKRPKVLKSGVQSDALFNIKKENVAHIFSILRNQLYSDKILAVVREYSTNAIDAHVEANESRPIEISLPNAFYKEFSIRDFGKGLSQEDIVDIFASYGASTKRESNEFTGMLGIGSKSAFAYTNNFTVISRHNGIEYTYGAYIDETNIGAISLISSQPTKESGVSIHISVPEKDTRAFLTTCYEFFKNLSYEPIFRNDTEVKRNLDFYKRNLKSTLLGKDWKIISSNNNAYHSSTVNIEMGNVLYPVSEEKIGEWFFPNQHRFHFNSDNKYSLLRHRNLSFIIHAPIGSVKPSASRESLEYNALTTDYVRTKIISIFNEIGREIRTNLTQLPTLYEKHCFANNIKANYGNNFNVDDYVLTVRDSKSFHRHSMPHDLKIEDIGVTKIRTLFMGGSSFYDSNEFCPKPEDLYFYNDGSVKAQTTSRRAIYYLENNNISNRSAYIFSVQDKDKFFKHKSFVGAEFIDLSTIPYIPKETDYIAPKSEKAEVYYFCNGNTNIESWKPAKSLPTNPVYIEISSFKPKNYESNKLLYTLRGSMCAVGMPSFDIYGVKSSDMKKTIQPNWIELKDYVKMELDKWKQIKQVNVEDYNHYHNMNQFWREFIKHKKSWEHLDKNYSNYKKVYFEYDNLKALCESVGIQIFVDKEPEEITEMKKKFPILNCFDGQIHWADYDKLVKFLDMS